jgi:hypothetical protein
MARRGVRGEKIRNWSANAETTNCRLRSNGHTNGDHDGRGPSSIEAGTETAPKPPRTPCTQSVSCNTCAKVNGRSTNSTTNSG